MNEKHFETFIKVTWSLRLSEWCAAPQENQIWTSTIGSTAKMICLFAWRTLRTNKDLPTSSQCSGHSVSCVMLYGYYFSFLICKISPWPFLSTQPFQKREIKVIRTGALELLHWNSAVTRETRGRVSLAHVEFSCGGPPHTSSWEAETRWRRQALAANVLADEEANNRRK